MKFFTFLLSACFIVIMYNKSISQIFSYYRLAINRGIKKLSLSVKQLSMIIALTIFSLLITKQNFAQTFGLTAQGTTNYPQTNIGNTQTASPGSNAGNTLIFDQFTTTVPLTAISIGTFGTVSSGTNNIKVSIYSDNGSNSPGTLQFTEVSATVTANSTSAISIPLTYLAPGKYWLAFNMNNSSSSTNYVTKSSGITGAVRMFTTAGSFTFSTAFPTNASTSLTLSTAAAGTEDMIYFVGVPIQGYAKATQATLSAFASSITSVSFYASALGHVRLGIYSNSSGAPSTKLWESGDNTITSTGLNIINISTGTPTTLTNLSSGTYWLAWQWSPTSSPTLGPSYTAGSSGTGNYIIQAYGSFPSSWTGGTATAENWTEYATYVACTVPTAYNLTAGGSSTAASYCSGGSGVDIQLSNSQTGVNYQLKVGSASVGSAVGGTTGSVIDFGTSAYAAGTYTVVATNTSGGCTATMTNSPIVTVNANPSASVSAQSNISCSGGSDGTITILGNGGTSPYSYSVNNGSTWTSSSSNPYVYTGLVANQAYQIRVKDSNGCASTLVH